MQMFSTRCRFPALAGLIIALSLPLSARAQATDAHGLHGRVTHAGSTIGIGSAVIDVTNVATGSLVGHATTTADGAFRVPLPRAGQYRVAIRALGFAPRTLPVVTVGAAAADIDIGVVALSEIPLQLQTQAVIA